MKKQLPFLLSLIILCSIRISAQQTIGLFLNDAESVNGYTLFASGRVTYLIDNCGHLINSWESDFVSNTSNYLLENGNLLRTSRVAGSFTGGGSAGRLELFSWEGDLLWSYNYATPEYHHHHDVEPLPNGNILILAWEAKTKDEGIEEGRDPNTIGGPGVWPERIVEVEMVGTNDINVVWEWHAWDHLVQDFDVTKNNYGVVEDHPELIDVNYGQLTGSFPVGSPDWIHANAIDYHPELDQIAISSRHFDEIWIIDHSTTTAEAVGHTGGNSGKGGDLLYRWGNPEVYKRGTENEQTLWGQHNITWILEEGHPHYGKLLVFNNGLGRPGGNSSSIDIWAPPIDVDGNYMIDDVNPFGPAQVEWTYDQPGFFSANISGVHSLPGGNLFVCEGSSGHFFEITLNGEIVWDYINPVSASNGPQTQTNPPAQNATFRATRYPAHYAAFENIDLTPGDPIELNPLPSDCVIFNGPVFSGEEKTWHGAWLRENPVNDQLALVNETNGLVNIEVFDLTGKHILTQKTVNREIVINVIGWVEGFYVLRVSNADYTQSFTQKFVKN